MRKEYFPHERRSKLLPRDDGPFQVLSLINDNSYNIDLPGEYGVSATFDVAALAPFLEYDLDLRANPLQVEGGDEGISTKAISIPTLVREEPDPVTRIQVKAFKGQLQAYLAPEHHQNEGRLVRGTRIDDHRSW
ncbi:unnamed protein product [Linum trigynum]|uniref:Tf2-1-like SH3-like domain-containing protein n=1 Tax=Linum trigynum TaxID=586398 RepID=A0AAV2FAD6_9ROSI